MSYILTPCLTNYIKIESGNSIKAFSKDMSIRQFKGSLFFLYKNFIFENYSYFHLLIIIFNIRLSNALEPSFPSWQKLLIVSSTSFSINPSVDFISTPLIAIRAVCTAVLVQLDTFKAHPAFAPSQILFLSVKLRMAIFF